MLFSLKDAFRGVAPELSEALVTPDARSTLQAIAKRLPPVMTSFGFECRLQEGASAVDLGFPVEANEGRDLLARGEVSRPLREDDAWRRIRALCERWSDPDSAMHRWVPFLCFEVDAASAGDDAPVPSLFVTLDSPLERLPDDPVQTRPEFMAMREAVPILSGASMPVALETNLVSCFAALPNESRVLHAGVMLSRQLIGVRLSVAASRGEVVPYLQKCSWAEATFEIEDTLLRYAADDTPVQFDFDVGASAIRPKLGIGLAPQDDASWTRLLAQLVEDGLCTQAKRAALLEWPGSSMASLDSVACVLRRDLSHVKLGCGPHQPREAKAYFGVTPGRSLFR